MPAPAKVVLIAETFDFGVFSADLAPLERLFSCWLFVQRTMPANSQIVHVAEAAAKRVAVTAGCAAWSFFWGKDLSRPGSGNAKVVHVAHSALFCWVIAKAASRPVVAESSVVCGNVTGFVMKAHMTTSTKRLNVALIVISPVSVAVMDLEFFFGPAFFTRLFQKSTRSMVVTGPAYFFFSKLHGEMCSIAMLYRQVTDIRVTFYLLNH